MAIRVYLIFIAESLMSNRLFATFFYTESLVFVNQISLNFHGIQATLFSVAVPTWL